MSLSIQAFSGIRWNILSMVVNLVGGMIQLFILVRFVEEKDFGLMAIFNTIYGFCLIFLDLGIGNAIIHKKEIHKNQLSSFFGITILSSILICLLLIFFSPYISSFYESPQLSELILFIGVAIIFTAIGHPYKILLSKNLYFDHLAIINILGFSIAFIVVVIMAYMNYGILALVFGLMVRMISESIIVLLISWKKFQLQLRFNIREMKYFINFGAFQLGENSLHFFAQNFDILLIGKLLGTEVLGVYDILKKLLLRPLQTINPIITNISFPLMSKIQDEVSVLSKVYLKQINYVSALNFPIYSILIFNAAFVLSFLFGENWVEHQHLFIALALGTAIMSTGNPVGSLILARGRPDIGFYWNLFMFIINPIVVLLSVRWNIIGIAIGIFILQLLLIIPNYYILVKRLIRSNDLEYFSQILIPFFLVTVSGCFCFFLFDYLQLIPLIAFISFILLFFSIYFLLSWRFNNSFMLDLWKLLNNEKN